MPVGDKKKSKMVGNDYYYFFLFTKMRYKLFFFFRMKTSLLVNYKFINNLSYMLSPYELLPPSHI
jgi:hypothetical protein